VEYVDALIVGVGLSGIGGAGRGWSA